jgi:hypothetical protein
MRDAQGNGVSRFLPFATDEGESQPVGDPARRAWENLDLREIA